LKLPRPCRAGAAGLVARGANCLIPGCTKVGLLLKQGNVAVPVYDTVVVHCVAAMDLAMQGADTPKGDDDV